MMQSRGRSVELIRSDATRGTGEKAIAADQQSHHPAVDDAAVARLASEHAWSLLSGLTDGERQRSCSPTPAGTPIGRSPSSSTNQKAPSRAASAAVSSGYEVRWAPLTPPAAPIAMMHPERTDGGIGQRLEHDTLSCSPIRGGRSVAVAD